MKTGRLPRPSWPPSPPGSKPAWSAPARRSVAKDMRVSLELNWQNKSWQLVYLSVRVGSGGSIREGGSRGEHRSDEHRRESTLEVPYPV
eukprot:1511570-Rhodomonas_salina.2